jgi:hypothetical protein
MSLKESAMTGLNSIIDKYIAIVSQRYNINQNELQQLWSNKNDSTEDAPQSTIKSSDSELNNLTKTELIQLCKSKNIKVSGSKSELIERILNIEGIKEEKAVSQPKQSVQHPIIIKKLVEKIPKLEISKNNFGNFEHKESGLVFDNKTQKVYGRQNSDGTVSDLTHEDINICNKYKFLYTVPNNFDKKVNILDIKVDELDEELEEEIEDDDDFNEDNEENEDDDDDVEYYEE